MKSARMRSRKYRNSITTWPTCLVIRKAPKNVRQRRELSKTNA